MTALVYNQLRESIAPYMEKVRSLSIDEKIGIGLDWLGQGAIIRNECEKLQQSPSTITIAQDEFVHAVILCFGHTTAVAGWSFCGSTNNLIPRDGDYHYHFQGAIGSIDGSHFQLMLSTTIKHVIGILEKHWRIFRFDNTVNKDLFCTAIIACCLLPNFPLDNDNQLEADSDKESYDDDTFEDNCLGVENGYIIRKSRR
eukprot:jgi/Psemu1/10380/gm1.10380_g